VTRREALIAIARAERDKARLKADHLRWAVSVLSSASPESAQRQTIHEAGAAELDVTIAEARLALAEMEADGPDLPPAQEKLPRRKPPRPQGG
jgi:hypothetical protein